MNVNEDNSDNEDGISILEKIVKIEDFFGVRLVRPDEVWEADLPKIDFLIALIECGYIEKNLPSYMISTNSSSRTPLIPILSYLSNEIRTAAISCSSKSACKQSV